METVSGKQYIGEAHLLRDILDDAASYDDMLVTELNRQWHGYFGLEIDTELRGVVPKSIGGERLVQ